MLPSATNDACCINNFVQNILSLCGRGNYLPWRCIPKTLCARRLRTVAQLAGYRAGVRGGEGWGGVPSVFHGALPVEVS